MTDAGLRIDDTREGLAFWIHVSPRSSRPGVGGQHGDALRVAVVEPPVGGKANAACATALARALDVHSRHIAVDPASKSRRKRVEIVPDSPGLRERLESLAASARLR